MFAAALLTASALAFAPADKVSLKFYSECL